MRNSAPVFACLMLSLRSGSCAICAKISYLECGSYESLLGATLMSGWQRICVVISCLAVPIWIFTTDLSYTRSIRPHLNSAKEPIEWRAAQEVVSGLQYGFSARRSVVDRLNSG
jgi:hypothetical protein